jgi:hypothetical protein
MGQIFLVVLVARLVGMYTPTFRWAHELGREPERGPGEAEGTGGTGTGAPEG